MKIANISEGNVLLATIKYLVTERKTLPYRISVASGKDIDHNLTKTKIKDLFKDLKREPCLSG